MINWIKNYLLDHNIDGLINKVHSGTATEQDKENLARMTRYAEKGHW